MYEHESRRRHDYALVAILLHAEEGRSQISRPAHDERMNLHAEAPSRGSDAFVEPIDHLGECRGCDILAEKPDL